MRFNNPEDIIALTPEWKGERFPDGRPKVPDSYLDALRTMTLEELWKPIFVQGYENQFLAMKSLHPEFKENGMLNCKLVGRAVTASYGPYRPDYYNTSMAQAAAEGRTGLVSDARNTGQNHQHRPAPQGRRPAMRPAAPPARTQCLPETPGTVYRSHGPAAD